MFQSAPHIVARVVATYHANRRPDDLPRDVCRTRDIVNYCYAIDHLRDERIAIFGENSRFARRMARQFDVA